jgi:hypothetical protein
MVIGVNNNDCPSVLALIDMGLILDANQKYDYKLFTKKYWMKTFFTLQHSFWTCSDDAAVFCDFSVTRL